MQTKKCPKCGKVKPVEEFFRNKYKRDGRQSRCKECMKPLFRAWYETHTKLHRKLADSWDRKKLVELNRKVVEYLREHPCVDCGEKDVLVLAFDHRRGKEKMISHMISYRYAWEKILKEIEKCEVRCANCHLKRHMKERKTMRWRVVEGLV